MSVVSRNVGRKKPVCPSTDVVAARRPKIVGILGQECTFRAAHPFIWPENEAGRDGGLATKPAWQQPTDQDPAEKGLNGLLCVGEGQNLWWRSKHERCTELELGLVFVGRFLL